MLLLDCLHRSAACSFANSFYYSILLIHRSRTVSTPFDSTTIIDIVFSFWGIFHMLCDFMSSSFPFLHDVNVHNLCRSLYSGRKTEHKQNELSTFNVKIIAHCDYLCFIFMGQLHIANLFICFCSSSACLHLIPFLYVMAS